jgi:PTH1 family peptidyl-tRNA hydrolase
MQLLVGLGNPGARYEKTRHNVGFLVVDRVAGRLGCPVERKLFGALVGEGAVAGKKVMFVKPQQFMNLSGQAVASIAGFYKVPVADVVVAHDELDLPFTSVKVKIGGGHAGHNGVRDLQRALGNDFVRVRIGVSRPPGGWDPADYVLANWTPEETGRLGPILDRAADAMESVARDGAMRAMNTFNAAEPAA